VKKESLPPPAEPRKREVNLYLTISQRKEDYLSRRRKKERKILIPSFKKKREKRNETFVHEVPLFFGNEVERKEKRSPQGHPCHFFLIQSFTKEGEGTGKGAQGEYH